MVQDPRAESIPLASTIVLLRDASEGYEVFMLKRTQQSTFPNLYVFPGGKVDAEDEQCDAYCDPRLAKETSAILGEQQDGLKYWVAAVRECFEECGVLFAHKNSDQHSALNNGLMQELRQVRYDLCNNAITFQVLLEKFSLQISVSEIHYLSHWITPKVMPARFDTRFFIGALPPGQDVDVHSTELVSGTWVRPKTALKRFAQKQWRMILPTITTLRMISSFESMARVIEYVKRGYHRIPVLTSLPIQGMQPYQGLWR